MWLEQRSRRYRWNGRRSIGCQSPVCPPRTVVLSHPVCGYPLFKRDADSILRGFQTVLIIVLRFVRLGSVGSVKPSSDSPGVCFERIVSDSQSDRMKYRFFPVNDRLNPVSYIRQLLDTLYRPCQGIYKSLTIACPRLMCENLSPTL